MLIIWFIVWWINHFPAVQPWNTWLITLLIAAVLDLRGSRSVL